MKSQLNSLEEIWKPIAGYEGLYEVSNLGRIKALPKWITNNVHKILILKKERIIKPSINPKGYLYVCLINGKYKTHLVHRLVADNFLLKASNDLEVNHLDGNRANNAVNNLQWSTHKENIAYSFANGFRNNYGSNNPKSKLNESDVCLIRNSSLRHTELAKKYQVSQSTISSIRSRSTWVHI